MELYRKKLSHAEEVLKYPERISLMISGILYERADVYTVASEAMGFDIPFGNFPEAWRDCCKNTVPDPELLRFLIPVGDILGSSEPELQAERLRIIRDDIKTYGGTLKKCAEDSKRLYLTLGASIGAAAAVLMI